MYESLTSLIADLKSIDHAASIVIVVQGGGAIVGVLFHSKARQVAVHHTVRLQRAVRRTARKTVRAAIVHVLDESRDPPPPEPRNPPTINL